jgi:hypothetical protein
MFFASFSKIETAFSRVKEINRPLFFGNSPLGHCAVDGSFTARA